MSNPHITDAERIAGLLVRISDQLKLLLVEQARMQNSLQIQMDRIERMLRDPGKEQRS